jgi:hypothetical protein
LDKKTDIGIQYYDFKTKRPIGNIEIVDKSEFDYMVSKGQWSEYKQDFLTSKAMNETPLNKKYDDETDIHGYSQREAVNIIWENIKTFVQQRIRHSNNTGITFAVDPMQLMLRGADIAGFSISVNDGPHMIKLFQTKMEESIDFSKYKNVKYYKLK